MKHFLNIEIISKLNIKIYKKIEMKSVNFHFYLTESNIINS